MICTNRTSKNSIRITETYATSDFRFMRSLCVISLLADLVPTNYDRARQS